MLLYLWWGQSDRLNLCQLVISQDADKPINQQISKDSLSEVSIKSLKKREMHARDLSFFGSLRSKLSSRFEIKSLGNF